MQTKNIFCDVAIEAVSGLSPYQPGKPISELERELGLHNIIKLASNENPLGPSAAVKEAIKNAIDDISLYPDGNGFDLKKALSEHLNVSVDSITLGNGSNDVLDMIARVFLKEGREAIFSEHAFVVYPIATQSVGATARVSKALSADSDQPYGHDLQAMFELINENTSVIFIANPNNPTGTWLRKGELKAFIESVPKTVMVVLDEAYGEYIDDEDYPNAIEWLGQHPNLIITRTFSKAYGLAGLRVGYSISHPDVADLINRIRAPFNVNSFALIAAEAALNDTQYIEQSRELNKQGLLQLAAGFKALELDYIPSVGNFISVDVGPDAAAIYNALLKEGVIVRPIAPYKLPNHLRISVGLEQQNTQCLAALKKVLPHV